MPTPAGIKTFSTNYEQRASFADFDSLKILLASPEKILDWSHGEVTKPETINYRTQRPERDGLFCEKIFGPVKDWECSCGKYKKIRYKGIICDKCGVEVTRSIIRRERMGHIKLAAPCSHIWFIRSAPSRVALILNISSQDLEKVIYFSDFIITQVKEDLKQETLEQLEKEYKAKKELLKKNNSENNKTHEKEIQELKNDYDNVKKDILEIKPLMIISESVYQSLSLKYGHFFEANIGAEAIDKLLSSIDFKKLINNLEEEKKDVSPAILKKISRRLKIIQSFYNNNIKPEWMILKILPVIPPELRPMVPLDGGRFASSDLNDLYRRVSNRNNRLKKIIDLNAPEIIIRNEKRMLQEAVDSLIDNGARHTKMITASTGQKRELKSLADILKGKQGRFRQNLLGKRVDYSGRSVIVVGPHLKLHQCGLPKTMALELFRPFIAAQLIKKGLVHNVRSANRFIETKNKEVWDTLEKITSKSFVLLNRAPTLHRLSIQAFQPVLIEGKAIEIHPLVCPPFNADFDGDTMSVHVPLTAEAKKEANDLMLASKNLLKPATGEPSDMPSQDMVLGAYYLTTIKEPKNGKMRIFSSSAEADLAYNLGKISLNEKAKVKMDGKIIEVSVGRIIFNSILPLELKDYDKLVNKNSLKKIITENFELFGTESTAILLDKIKETTFKYLTKSGLSWGFRDLPFLEKKKEIIKEATKKVDLVERQYQEGLLAADERYQRIIEIWTEAKDEMAVLVKEGLDKESSVFSMIDSGARGSWELMTQMMGMKGLVINPQGETIELPVKANFKEGFDVLEYFISTHGGRKGLIDTALRTATAGYLTRRLIDVAHEVIIQEDDCKTDKGIIITKEESEERGDSLIKRITGRVALENITNPSTNKIIVKKNSLVTEKEAKEIEKLDLKQVKIRSALTCESLRGICQKCYGYNLGYNKLVDLGAAVGIIAAQSIGEPGTQLTLRTFHGGGVASSEDITQGLPRVQELFEARTPKKKALLTEIDGKIEIVKEDGQKKVKVNPEKITEDQEIKEYFVPPYYNILVKNGDLVEKGDPLTEGSLDLYELYNLKGKEAVQKYLLKEIQFIYSSQGQSLNDKHLEIIIRQMFSRCLVKDAGESNLLSGEVISNLYFEKIAKEIKKDKNKKMPQMEELLLGITKVSLSTDSFLSAASFQETSRILIDASTSGKIDYLTGLKENVIIGRLVPVGTGWKKLK